MSPYGYFLILFSNFGFDIFNLLHNITSMNSDMYSPAWKRNWSNDIFIF